MKHILFCVGLATVLFSCSSNDDSPQVGEANFYALTVGNSWVYKNYRYNNSTDAYDDTGVIDSISIVGTEDISGIAYFKFRRWTTGNEAQITFCNPNGEHFEFLREFEGALIKDDGTIKYVNNDYTERLLQENSWGNIYETLVEATTEIITEAGTFNCINSERFTRNLEDEQLAALDRFYYSNGIGLIHDTSSFVSSDIPSIKRRLDSYIVE